MLACVLSRITLKRPQWSQLDGEYVADLQVTNITQSQRSRKPCQYLRCIEQEVVHTTISRDISPTKPRLEREALQPGTLFDIASLASASNIPEPLAGTEATPTPVRALILPPVALSPHGALGLEEYLNTCKNEIKGRQRTYAERLVEVFAIGLSDKDQVMNRLQNYEKRLVKSFVAGMNDEEQCSILASRTRRTGMDLADRIRGDEPDCHAKRR